MEDIKILALDDEEILLLNFKEYFSEYNVFIFTDPIEALDSFKIVKYDIIISDFKMPKMNGIEFLSEVKKLGSSAYSILLTAYADKELLEQMINDNLVQKIVEKPILMRDFKQILEEAISRCFEIRKRNAEDYKIRKNYYNLKEEYDSNRPRIIGLEKGLKKVYEKVSSIAKHPVTVLITGETGTGKELIARAIHELSPRKDYPFVKINTTAIPDTLFESELFGYNKGAFSNAITDKPGKFELADKGTLFLDEIGDMGVGLQTKLLRVIQEKEVERLGSNKTIKVDFRLIVATNKGLQECIKNNTFREDLFYRINDFPIELPPLRDRAEDIEDLVKYFLNKYSIELNIKNITISKDALERLKKYSWPGNIRELENAIKRVVIVAGDKGEVTPNDFHFIFPDMVKNQSNLDEAIRVLRDELLNGNVDLQSIEELTIKSILDYFSGNIADAVERTGLSKNRFYKYK